jgi:hypothetical protein
MPRARQRILVPREAILVLAAAIAALPGRAHAQQVKPLPVDSAARPKPITDPKQLTDLELVKEAISHITARAQEATDMRTRAAKDGFAIKTSCIDQKLRAIHEALAETQGMHDKWSQTDTSVELRGRWVERARVLRAAAIANLEACRSCTDARPGTAQLTAEYIGPAPVPTPGEVLRPPTVDRTPLATMY